MQTSRYRSERCIDSAYAAPIIMMSQNRQNIRDRLQAEEDYKTNKEAKQEIEELAIRLKSIEVDKLDKIIELLLEQRNNSIIQNKRS